MSDLVFQLSNVSYQYGAGLEAVRNLSLSVYSGESVALLGANGCGKSTLIKLMNGLLVPTEGVIKAFGEPLHETTLRAKQAEVTFRRRVGFVFQNADAQLFSPTVREELAFAPLQIGISVPEVKQRVQDIAELLRVAHLLERSPFQLSGGEKRKICLGCVLTMNPDVLLLDEPTTGLDPRSQEELISLLHQLIGAGKTLVTATHDIALAARITTRCIVMSESHEIARQGETSETLADIPFLRSVNLIA
ncbi:MAG: ABC transporter ATP-binding protein [Armatimonadetes bacterium]|nr:ABC transporter ATP-binding protein [Armatimonadota bacterium]